MPEREHAEPTTDPAPAARSALVETPASLPALALRLQRSSGNAATLRALGRYVNPDARKDSRPDEYGKLINTDHTGNKRGRIQGSLYVYDASLGQDTSGIDISDIKQGNLGDCWFLSAVMAVAKLSPATIKRLIKGPLPEKRDGANVYEISLYERHNIGSPTKRTVRVDDTFVLSSDNTSTYSQPIQRSAIGPELWVLLLEKAWAAINGGYSKIHFGDSRAGMVAVTGEDVDTLDPSGESEKSLTAELREYAAERKPMTIQTKQKYTDKELADIKTFVGKDIVPSHAYAIERVHADTAHVDIRNPWGVKHLPDFPISFIPHWFSQIVVSEEPV